MSSQIFVEPGITSAAVISVGGQCYRYAGDSDVEPDTFAIDKEFAECCVPAPCSCPEDSPTSYTLHFAEASVTDSAGNVYAWGSQDVVVSGLGGGDCTFGGFIDGTFNGTPFDEEEPTVILTVSPSFDCNGICVWRIGILLAVFFTSQVGATPDLGVYVLYTQPINCTDILQISGTATVTVTTP